MKRPVWINFRFSRLAGLYLLIIAASPAAFAMQGQVKSIESTMAYELLTLEAGVRTLPPDAVKLFREAITDATDAAVRTNRHPQTRADALAVLEAIQLALVKHNFLQPANRTDWPDTIGIALTPLKWTPAALNQASSFGSLQLIDRTKPFYYVDCDMGAELVMTVGERLGWDIRLVEVPDHNFVRWHLSDSIKVNWDWTYWTSKDDSRYRPVIGSVDDVRLRELYLRSFEIKEARSYYVGLIASKADKDKPMAAERLFQEAVAVLPHHPLTLNNFAWLYATRPVFNTQKLKTNVAVAYGLGAWSMQPNDGNIADTVACSLAANGSKVLAAEVEQFASDHASSPAEAEKFKAKKELIAKGILCVPD
ncbi:MAG: hypothetical protein AABN95_26510 [Acidobacteriota bacterium]